MRERERSAVELAGFVIGVLAVICLGAAAMSLVNLVAGFFDGRDSTYLVVCLASLALAVALGLAAGILMSWSDPERRWQFRRREERVDDGSPPTAS